jgi:hypothetical protein
MFRLLGIVVEAVQSVVAYGKPMIGGNVGEKSIGV